nr:immunoglobulin light chain junction region [Macaca mulatta]MOX74515.1 immunoglobulin light chain junction region [Macaca mulatta]MOX77326.1 immunoglobulin light chain junction region [Macaca mulatta]
DYYCQSYDISLSALF